MIHPVILCGGSGTRLWPRSRKHHPKPFLPLLGDTTLFEQTLDRTGVAERYGSPIVIAGNDHVALIRAQMRDPKGRLIVEPSARNTAPAIALAALALPADAVMLVCPSDHHIADLEAFQAVVDRGAALARDGWLVSLGIEPTGPETGFGYLKAGEALGDLGLRTDRFVEKPGRARAESFLADGGYFWNGGIFLFTAGRFLDELGRHRPDMLALARQSFDEAESRDGNLYPAAAPFEAIAKESVDYAVMENTDRAALVPASIGWSDIGSWDALHDAMDRDAHGNAARGETELVDCRNVLVEAGGRRVSIIGLEDVIVVADGDDILITSRAGAQQVGKLAGASRQ